MLDRPLELDHPMLVINTSTFTAIVIISKMKIFLFLFSFALSQTFHCHKCTETQNDDGENIAGDEGCIDATDMHVDETETNWCLTVVEYNFDRKEITVTRGAGDKENQPEYRSLSTERREF